MKQFLAGASLRQIKKILEERHIPFNETEAEWSITSIRSILRDEKNSGDVLMQKTFISDCISKKQIKNTGQLPMYLVQNNHTAIISRDDYHAVQAELARRNTVKSASTKYSTGKYTSKYALSDRLYCGECGTRYRRVTWTGNGKNQVVWRCVSRLDFGKKYCHNSPSIPEIILQYAIIAAINSSMRSKDSLIQNIVGAMELEFAPLAGESLGLADIEQRLEEISSAFSRILIEAGQSSDRSSYLETFKSLSDEAATLKHKEAMRETNLEQNPDLSNRIKKGEICHGRSIRRNIQVG